MIPILPGLQAHLSQPYQTTCTIWKTALVNGTKLGFTDLDRDIIYDALVYKAQTGYTRTDIGSGSDLSVDNMEVDGMISAPSITEDDLRLGIWDFADVEVSLINWAEFFTYQPITTIVRTGSTANVSTLNAHGLTTGDQVEIGGADQPEYNGRITASVSGSHTFQYPVLGSPGTPATGLLYFQPNSGRLILRSGKIGEVTLERNTFKAEIRGKAQAYARTLGELTCAGCRAQLFDARCKVDPTTFTKTGTLTGVLGNIVFYDSSRTEPGPAGGIVITGITNANPCIVTLADGSSFSNGEAVMLSGILGPDLLNASTFIRALSGNSFSLGIDTTNITIYPVYTGGGICTPLGADSGYFDFGIMTMTSGVCNGMKMEVRAYVPGQWILQLPFADGLLTPSPGDTYIMIAGCDKSLSTCKTKFSNVINMRSEPYLPGLDKIVQVGKQP